MFEVKIRYTYTMKIMAFESSCDETAVAIVEISDNGTQIHANQIYSQFDEHVEYGGVVPEVAARAHLSYFDPLVKKALEEANMSFKDIDAFAATAGPGLLGGVMIGFMYAKSLSLAFNKPFIGTNHLEGHALTPHLTDDIDFPYLLLLVSGGHCQFIHVKDLGDYHTLGGTIDDAIGEAFDKVAKMLDLPYPGGPQIEKLAQKGDKNAYKFPLPLKDKGIDFSFSGLKTSVRQRILTEEMTEQRKADIAASFQETVAQIIEIKAKRAIEQTAVNTFVVAGGVAANKLLRQRLENLCTQKGITFAAPPLKLCTDNAVMIAYAAAMHSRIGQFSELSMSARPRWPLEEI